MSLSQKITVALMLFAAAAGGWFARSPRTVLAADTLATPFQFQGVGPDAQLSVYDSSEHTLYVYRGVMNGNSTVFCAYKLKLGRAGAPLERENCPVGNIRY